MGNEQASTGDGVMARCYDSARRANLKKPMLGRLDCIIADELSLSQTLYQMG